MTSPILETARQFFGFGEHPEIIKLILPCVCQRREVSLKCENYPLYDYEISPDDMLSAMKVHSLLTSLYGDIIDTGSHRDYRVIPGNINSILVGGPPTNTHTYSAVADLPIHFSKENLDPKTERRTIHGKKRDYFVEFSSEDKVSRSIVTDYALISKRTRHGKVQVVLAGLRAYGQVATYDLLGDEGFYEAVKTVMDSDSFQILVQIPVIGNACGQWEIAEILSIKQPHRVAKEGRPSRSAGLPQLSYAGKPRDPSTRTILHLSDLHMRPEINPNPQTMLHQLSVDLKSQGLDNLDFIVVSGDLTDFAGEDEFETAFQFLVDLKEAFNLKEGACVVVPGNHDLCWYEDSYLWKSKRVVKESTLKPGTFVEKPGGYLVRNEELSELRFDNFSKKLYYPLARKVYPASAAEQCLPFLFKEEGIQFLALNSCWEIDEEFPTRSGINDDALTTGLYLADEQIAQAVKDGKLPKDPKILRIAIWHHPLSGDGQIIKNDFLDRLRKARFKICLHGHIHEDSADIVGYIHPTQRLHVVGAGSFGASSCKRPESTPRLYDVLEIDIAKSKVRVNTRCLRKRGGTWEPWAVWPNEERPETPLPFYEIDL